MQHSSDQAALTRPAMSYTQMLEHIRYDGAYPTRARAEEVTTAVLSALGQRLTDEERRELAERLPREAARLITLHPPRTDTVTGWAFVKELAGRTGGTLATTRWDVGSVFGVVSQLAGSELLDRIIARLPSGYAILFGRPELLQTQAA